MKSLNKPHYFIDFNFSKSVFTQSSWFPDAERCIHYFEQDLDSIMELIMPDRILHESDPRTKLRNCYTAYT
jgi:hypothetical protein